MNTNAIIPICLFSSWCSTELSVVDVLADALDFSGANTAQCQTKGEMQYHVHQAKIWQIAQEVQK